MKIAITCPASIPATPFGGILIVSVNLAKQLSYFGHNVTIYTTDLNFSEKTMIFDKRLPKIEKVDGFTIKRSHVFFHIFLIFVNPQMYRQIKTDMPDIIHAIGVRAFQSFIAAIFSKFSKVPLVISDYGGLTTHPDITHGSLLKRALYKLQTPILKFILNQAAKVIAANEYEVEDFSKLTKKEKIVIVKNGIDLKLFQKNPFDFKLKYNISGRIILFVGRFDKIKGIDLLLKSYSMICNDEQFLDVKLLVMGSDFGFLDKMLEMIKKLGLENRVQIIQNPSRESVIAAYYACEFLILPSRWELSPLTPLEGFACKKTVISTKAYGIPYVIEDKKNCILVEPENSDSLAYSIASLLLDKEKAINLGENGYELVRDTCNSQTMTENISLIYQSIINQT